jgi:hypothetical protein
LNVLNFPKSHFFGSAFKPINRERLGPSAVKTMLLNTPSNIHGRAYIDYLLAFRDEVDPATFREEASRIDGSRRETPPSFLGLSQYGLLQCPHLNGLPFPR